MVLGKALNRIINVFTGLFAIATLVLMLVWYLNRALDSLLLPESAVLTVERFRNYFTLATIFLAGIEFTLKRNIVFAIIFAVIVVAVAAFMIYADVSLIEEAKKKAAEMLDPETTAAVLRLAV